MNWQAIGNVLLVVVVIVSILLPIWQSRDKIKIKIDEIAYRTSTPRGELKVYLNGEIERSGAVKERLLLTVLLKPVDGEAYSELHKYFSLPEGDRIPLNGPLNVRKNFKVTLSKLAGSNYKPVLTASSKAERIDQKNATEGIARELEQKGHSIALVWGDSRKIKWKTITKEDYGKWVAF